MTDILAEYAKLFEEIPETRPKDLAKRMSLVRPSRDGYDLCMMWAFDVANPMFDDDLMIHLNEAIPVCRCAVLEWCCKDCRMNTITSWTATAGNKMGLTGVNLLVTWMACGGNDDMELIHICREIAHAINAGKETGNG